MQNILLPLLRETVPFRHRVTPEVGDTTLDQVWGYP
jgi:hypothetical protein